MNNKVRFIGADRKIHAEGELPEQQLSGVNLLKHYGRLYGYLGLSKGVLIFVEYREPWDVTDLVQPVVTPV